METKIYRRHGTRVRAQIPVRISSLDPINTFSENCYTLLVNPRGCGVRFPRPLPPGSPVRVDQLPGGGSVTARVACSLAPAKGSRFWIVGIGLDFPGNPWCLAPAPEDWGADAEIPKFFPASATGARAHSRLAGIRSAGK